MFETALSRRTAIAAGLTAAGASLVAQAGIAQADEAKAPKPVILVVSFGTSYNDSRHITIGAIEDAIRETYPDYDVRRAFTAQIIINKLAERDGIVIDNFEQAMDKLVEEGVQKVIVQPTHLMAGYEYTDVLNSLQSNYADKFEAIVLGDPLLTSDEDYSEVVEAICDATAEYDDGQTAICFMGHGTEADSNEDYTHLQQVRTDAGHTSYFVGTVEATPTFDDVVEAPRPPASPRPYCARSWSSPATTPTTTWPTPRTPTPLPASSSPLALRSSASSRAWASLLPSTTSTCATWPTPSPSSKPA